MTTYPINTTIKIFHYDHDDYCVMEQETNEKTLQTIINVKDMHTIIDALTEIATNSRESYKEE